MIGRLNFTSQKLTNPGLISAIYILYIILLIPIIKA
ncbi:hypothetical protein SAMN05421813_10251 [Daejeonella rubra]|uniref:Uncharacterized protein n=1 Tax=Daejeonella rubra TaxID=990371 RepID=A0A1G9MP46_9SPHI|nr:hypothetical protein SAMN05421813_10251 [Daejeonella rubra]